MTTEPLSYFIAETWRPYFCYQGSDPFQPFRLRSRAGTLHHRNFHHPCHPLSTILYLAHHYKPILTQTLRSHLQHSAIWYICSMLVCLPASCLLYCCVCEVYCHYRSDFGYSGRLDRLRKRRYFCSHTWVSDAEVRIVSHLGFHLLLKAAATIEGNHYSAGVSLRSNHKNSAHFSNQERDWTLHLIGLCWFELLTCAYSYCLLQFWVTLAFPISAGLRSIGFGGCDAMSQDCACRGQRGLFQL